MKKNILCALWFLSISLYSLSQGEFITMWDLSKPGSDPKQISFFTDIASGGALFNWQELPSGASGSGTLASGVGLKVIDGIPQNSSILLKISPDNLNRFFIEDGSDKQRLIDIEQWGHANWKSMENAFFGCSNLNISASDVPDLSAVQSLKSMFQTCTSLNSPANIGSWNTSNVQNFMAMFYEATSFNQNINSWNTGAATDMSSMFTNATAFNQPLNNWNTSQVTNMMLMFAHSFANMSSFNQSLNNWNTSSVVNMVAMFGNATSFNQNLGNWTLNPNVNLSNLLTGSGMDCFNYAATITGWTTNNPTVNNRDLGAGGVSIAQFGMSSRNTLINTRGWTIDDAGQSNCGEFITSWNTALPGSGATQLQFNLDFTDDVTYVWREVPTNNWYSGTFSTSGLQTVSNLPANKSIMLYIQPQHVQRFYIDNGPDRLRFINVERWGSVQWTSMEGAFYGCENLDNLSPPDQPDFFAVSSMKNMFKNCNILNFINNISAWQVGSVTNMESMFEGCVLVQEEIDTWDVGNVTTMKSMFEGAESFNWDINSWNVSQVENFSSMFRGALNFDQELNNWFTGNVNDMSNMFRGAVNFNGLIHNWNTEQVTDMSGMFYGAAMFNQDISNWNTYQVTNMSNMFRDASSFDQELNYWNVEQVVNFSGMFMNAEQFKRDLSLWNTGAGQNFADMFNGALIFDADIDNWNMSNAQDLSYMFANTQNFNGVIKSWNVSNVQEFGSMFQNAASFNGDINPWALSSAINLGAMFAGANSFNQDLSTWNVSNVENMHAMFHSATSFNQFIGSWVFSANVDLSDMLNYSGLDCSNYSATLEGWFNSNPSLSNKNLGAVNLMYGWLGAQYRDALIQQNSWNIYGDNPVNNNPHVVQPGSTHSAILACYGEFVKSDDVSQRLVAIDPNNNFINLNLAQVTATNASVSIANPDVYTINDYYETNDGQNTLRISRRLFKIEAPGTFNNNGGVRVRLYINPDDFDNIQNDLAPAGTISTHGWFKASSNDFSTIVNAMNASSPQMLNGITITPVQQGTELGVHYVDFIVPNFSVFGYYSSTFNSPLPVTLSSLNANCQGETIQLNWRTASEFNASHYIIQNSRDGLNWTDLGEVAASGTTNQATNYSFETKNFGGLSYFRLLQVDLDGTTEIFGPVSANCELENSSMMVYPNPTAENFSVRIETKEAFENATLELLDNMGRVVLSRTLNVMAGTTTIPFESKDLQAGVYILRMRGEGEKFKPVQVIKL